MVSLKRNNRIKGGNVGTAGGHHLSKEGNCQWVVAITAIEITMATEFLPESKAEEKLEVEGWREREREAEKEGWSLS